MWSESVEALTLEAVTLVDQAAAFEDSVVTAPLAIFDENAPTAPYPPLAIVDDGPTTIFDPPQRLARGSHKIATLQDRSRARIVERPRAPVPPPSRMPFVADEHELEESYLAAMRRFR